MDFQPSTESEQVASLDEAQPAPQRPADEMPRAASAAELPIDGAASAARGAETTAVSDHKKYTITIPQAREQFALKHRRVPSERTLQDYCAKETIAAFKIRTSLNGVARTEWLINEQSLESYINGEPELRITPTADNPAAAPQAPHAAAQPTADRAASAAEQGSAAPPTTNNAPTYPPVEVVGETRTLADVLIENARILASAEGKDLVIAAKEQQISELRDDRAFLREEIREARRNRDDVRSIASQMLETIRSMAAGRLAAPPAEPPQPPASRMWEHDEKPGSQKL